MTEPLPREDPLAFGLIVVGDEVLNGTRSDGHLAAFKGILGARGHTLAWYWMLPDDPEVLTAHLRFSLGRDEPVFVCGGIGATPDDRTRACAAAAVEAPLVRHPEASALIEERFGADAYPHRILMADFPAGAEPIPNPINRIPGFRLARHWFLPGFPQMAWPMAEWVLDSFFGRAGPVCEVAVEVLGVPESAMIPLMEELGASFPDLKVFSLPHMGDDPHILLGLRGRNGLKSALDALSAGLRSRGFAFRARTDR